MRLGELCAGYGGLGMAVEEVFGATTAWFSEFDDAPSKILAHHWPDVPNYGDMTKIDWASIEPVDIISGGTPCQDLSAAGRRAGMTEGTRSNLWVQMREAIATQRPRYVVWENVRGAYSATAASDLEQCPGCMGDTGNGGTVLRALGRVLGDLSDLGYDTQWRGLRAADVGACHGRFRVFVLARRSDVADSPSWVSGEGRESAPGQKEAWRAPGDAGRSRGARPPAHAHDAGRGEQRRTITVRTEHSPAKYTRTDAAYAESLGWGEGWAESAGQLRGLATASDSAPATDADRGNDARRLGDAERIEERREASSRSGQGTNWGEYEPAIRRWEARLGRPTPRPTEPTGRNNGERLSPRFTEWMMGLPDGWVTDPAIGISRNDQLKACGNGVVPQQAIAALRDMLHTFQAKDLAA